MHVPTFSVVFLLTYGAILLALSLLTYFSFYGRHAKQLVYEVLSAGALPTRSFGESGYALAVITTDQDPPVALAEPLFLAYLRLTNPTRARIFGHDFTDEDPLRLELHGGEVVDIALLSATDPGIEMRVAAIQQTGTTTSARLSFHSLGYRDESIIQVISKGVLNHMALRGTVRGMSMGMTRAEPSTAAFMSWVKCRSISDQAQR